MIDFSTIPLSPDDPVCARIETYLRCLPIERQRRARTIYRKLDIRPRMGTPSRVVDAIRTVSRITHLAIDAERLGEDPSGYDAALSLAMDRFNEASHRVRHANKRIIRVRYGHRCAGKFAVLRHGRSPRSRRVARKAGAKKAGADPDSSSSEPPSSQRLSSSGGSL